MPAAIPLIAGGLAASAVGGGIFGAIVGGIVTTGLNLLLAPDPPRQTFDRADQARGLTQNISNPVAPIPVIYGAYRVAGSRIHTEVTGTDNRYLHLVIAWCEGPIEAIDYLYFDDVRQDDARFSGLLSITHHLGDHAQTADAGLDAVSSLWTSAHRLRGVAYTYVRLDYDAQAFPGVPVVSADIRGRIVANVTTAALAYSNNPADCIYDYLTNTLYGRGIPGAEIDLPSFQTARAICAATISNSPEPSQATYTCDGLINIDTPTLDNLRQLLSCCRGYLIHTGGLYRLIIDQAEATAFEFDETNITGAWQIALDAKSARYNRVRARFYNAARSYQPDLMVVDSSGFRVEDAGTLLEREIDLPFVTDEYRARRIAELELKASRYTIVVTFSATLEGLRAEVGSVIEISHATPGWNGKKFRITQIELDSAETVRITAREYATIYTPTAPPSSVPPGTVTIPKVNNVLDSLDVTIEPDTSWIYTFEAGDVAGWAQNNGTIANDSAACVGLKAGLVTHGGGGNVASASIVLPVSFVATALAVANRQIRIQCWAKQPASNAAAGFKMRAVGSSQNSAWQTFSTSGTCAAFGFVWRPTAAQTTITIEVQGDSNNAGTGATLIDNLTAFILPDFIDSASISTWIDSAAIGSAYIADLAVTTAKIASAAVTNAKIQTAAVQTLTVGGDMIIPARAASGTYAVEGSIGAWVNVASLTLPATTGGVLHGTSVLMFSWATCAGLTTFGPPVMRLLRDGNLIWPPSGSRGLGVGEVNSMIIHTEVVGDTVAHTYTAQFMCQTANGGGTDLTVTDWAFVLMEAKR